MRRIIITVGGEAVGDILTDADRKLIDDTAADEGAGGMSLLCELAVGGTLPADYEWTGDEEYEIVRVES